MQSVNRKRSGLVFDDPGSAAIAVLGFAMILMLACLAVGMTLGAVLCR